jgi:prevent-host-death family protein
MRKTSVRELHIHTSQLVREAAEGAVIVIERRGEPVAELRPLTGEKRISAKEKARIIAEMRRFRARMPETPDSTQAVSEDRDGR